MKRGTEREDLKKLIIKLERFGKKENIAIWKRASKLLASTRRRRVEVNIGKIAKVCSDNETALVPGKVLGDGIIEKKIKVAAFEWTQAAKKNIEKAGGQLITLAQLIEENPKGTDVRLMR